MGIKLSDLLNKQRDIKVEYEDETINLTVKSDFYTPAVEAIMHASNESNAPLAVNARILADAIIEWDITDDKGKPLPPSEDVLKQMGSNLINALVTAITESGRPPEKK